MRIAMILVCLFFFQFNTTAGVISKKKGNPKPKKVAVQSQQVTKPSEKVFTSRNDRFKLTRVSTEGGNDYYHSQPGEQVTKPSEKVFTSRNDRFKLTRVSIEGGNDYYHSQPGELVTIKMAVRHDCGACGNAINQVIVGLSSDDRAQVTVWNGKQRSGGKIYIINRGSSVETYGQANSGPAQWVDVTYQLRAPTRPGSYDIRARYAQAYQGNILTDEGRKLPQKIASEPLKWWKVDRPNGPDSDANIGKIIVQ